MNDYTGKICPYCKTAFTPQDDIILCSQCEMPHHKECWIENQGCTTFGCLGTISGADSGASSVTTTRIAYEDIRRVAPPPVPRPALFCTNCGRQIPGTSVFCGYCGHKLDPVPVRAPQTPVYSQANFHNSDPYSRANPRTAPYQPRPDYRSAGYNAYGTVGVEGEIQQLVGEETEYYVNKFQALRAQGDLVSWNWPAFLAAPFWMIYRKMYVPGAALLAVDAIISLIGSIFLFVLAFVGNIALGILGNGIYLKYLEGKANQAKAMAQPYKTQFLIANSGVDSTSTIFTILGYAVFVIILIVV